VNRHALTTRRLGLEPVREAHADLVFAQMSDTRLWTYFAHLRPGTLEDLRALYRRWERGTPTQPDETWENWLCFLRADGAGIGSLQATIRGQAALLAYAIYVPYQRQGYAREAAAAVLAHLRSTHRVKTAIAEMDPRNEASIGLAQSLGFVRVRKGQRGTDLTYELTLR